MISVTGGTEPNARRCPLLAFVKTARRIPQTHDRFLGVGGWGNARAGTAVCPLRLLVPSQQQIEKIINRQK